MSKQEQKESELRPEKPAYGFFDIDGTLTEGLTILSFAEFLQGKGCFLGSSWREIQRDFEVYGQSDKGLDAYRKFAINLVDHYADGLAGQRISFIDRQSEAFFEKALRGEVRGYKILHFSRDLVRAVGSHSKTIAISGSPTESLLPLKGYLGFDELRATTLETRDGIYTGRVSLNLAIDSSKEKVLGEYLREGIDFNHSFAFGDSPHDLPLLEAVGNPFVLGSNSTLHNIASKRGYGLFGENVVNEVNKRLANG